MADQTPIPPPIYRKLTRMHRGIGMMTQLWLGGDHLLHVVSTGYTETYRRFYLRDIQTMLLVHTARRTYFALTLAVLLLITASIVYAADGGPLAYGIAAVIFLPLFVWNHLLGVGCRVVVVTAVQQERVASFCRLPKTRRIIEELKPLIETAQAGLDVGPDPLAATEDSPPVSPEVASPLPPPLPPPLPSS